MLQSRSKHTIERDTDTFFIVKGENGVEHKAHVRIRCIYCGKGCKGCPHKAYKYAVYWDEGKVKEIYLGKVKATKVPALGPQGTISKSQHRRIGQSR